MGTYLESQSSSMMNQLKSTIKYHMRSVIRQWIPFTYPCPYLVQLHQLVPFEGQVLFLFQLTLIPPIFSKVMSVHTVYAGNSFVHTINKS